jgi:hypothetical protein
MVHDVVMHDVPSHLTEFPFMELPTEMQITVLGFLDHASLCAVSEASRALHSLAYDDTVWESVWSRAYPDETEQAVTRRNLECLSLRSQFADRWAHRVVCVGSWAIARRNGEVHVVNRHMNRHGGVALVFSKQMSTSDEYLFAIRAYHGAWTVSLKTGVTTPTASLAICDVQDWTAPSAPEPEFQACGMRFVPSGRHTMHVIPMREGCRIQRLTLNGLSVGWLDLQVEGKLQTIYPSDRLDVGL